MTTPGDFKYGVPALVWWTGEWIAGNPSATVPPNVSNSSVARCVLGSVVSKRLPSLLGLFGERLAHLPVVYTASERARRRVLA
jgi:hypothetical protein